MLDGAPDRNNFGKRLIKLRLQPFSCDCTSKGCHEQAAVAYTWPIRHHFLMRILTLLISFTLITTPFLAAAQEPIKIGAAQVLSLCPGVGQPGLHLGEPRSAQDPTFLSKINHLPRDFEPFTEADLDLTSWSDRLAGITYLAASPDGAFNQLWIETLQESLEAEGWTPSPRRHLAATGMLEAKMYEKTVQAKQGSLTLLVQFDTPGALILSCGDVSLLELANEEYEGRLAPGTPRPVPPIGGMQVPLPTEKDCAEPELLSAFSDVHKIDETNLAFRKLVAGGETIADLKRHQDRLHSWLRWRLIGSGKVTQQRIWELGDQANASSDAEGMEMMQAMFEKLTRVTQAQEKGDPSALCKAMVGLVIATAHKEQRDTELWIRANAALEEEARNLGLKLD